MQICCNLHFYDKVTTPSQVLFEHYFPLPPTERMSPLQRVVFLPHAVSPARAASAPLWAPCLPPTCTSTPSPSMTRYPPKSTRSPLVTPLSPHPAEWPAPTLAAWGPSLSWSLPRTGMGPLCKAELGSFSAHYDCHYSIHCSSGICEGAQNRTQLYHL